MQRDRLNLESAEVQNNELLPLNCNKLPTDLNGYTKPTYFYCKNCQKANVSDMNISPNTNTWLACTLFSCFCCCCTPFFIKDCNSMHHYCSVCNIKVGFTK
ncbi:hypothetical protein ABPG72_016037 [Tetrahymena utriculariae]